MASKTGDQLNFSLFDTTSLYTGLTLVPTQGGLRYREPDDEDQEEAAPAPREERVPARGWRLTGTQDRALAQGWKTRATDNIAAIRLAASITAEDRHATAEEQETMSRFVGFGASDLANGMFRRPGEAFRKGWENLGSDLEQAVSPEQLAGLARATQYAHYTPEFIVRAMWRAVTRMGIAGGTVLEPGCGTGLFVALMPEALTNGRTHVTAIEMDPCTAQIAKLLHPDAWVRCEDFTKARIAETFELAIGNPPYSDRTVKANDPAGKLDLSMHDYFIARSIERLKVGGIGAFVTSRYTMDKANTTARDHIARMADLVGAVRLPRDSMFAAAGTQVVADVLFFQKRAPTAAPNGIEWSATREVVAAEDGEASLHANEYFVERPHMVLGAHARTSGPFGPTYTCSGAVGEPLEESLRTALDTLPTGIHQASGQAKATKPEMTLVSVGTAAEGATKKEGSYLIEGDELVQVVEGMLVPVRIRSGTGTEGIPAKHARILRAMIPIRDWARAMLRAQEANQPWAAAQVRLRVAYTTFKRNFGAINTATVSTSTDPKTGAERETLRRPNLQPFLDDPDCWLVSSVEEYNQETGIAKQGPIFSERVIHPPAEPVVVTAADALTVTLQDVGHVDLNRIAELIGRPREEIVAELGGAVFLNPARSLEGVETWETYDAYLSGAVRTKLAVAEAAALVDPALQRNVDALRLVQPEDLKPSDITARLGGPWLPASDIEAFSAEVIGVATRIRHTVEIAAWSVDLSGFVGNAEATSTWGTERRHAGLLLSDALNSTVPQIFDTVFVDGNETRVLNEQETEAAKEKLGRIRETFERWVWTDPDRTDRLARIYNDRYNNLVPRTFDGSHLHLPGASSAVSLRSHQKRGIWRALSAGSTYLAHAVGAGKTFSLAAIVMEQKRLGLASKPMMVVPGHCLEQAAREFVLLYPSARLLVADETNFAKDKRARFLARAATANWDCIIITHSAFKFIAVPAWFEHGLIADEMQIYEEMLNSSDDDGDRFTRKRLEHAKEVLQAKLEALSTSKDNMLTIAEIGVDQLIVDEAHEFRKLSFATNMSSLKGVDPNGSQRAWDLMVKARFLELRSPGRSLMLASGTPLTNTLGEMYSLLRFMSPEALEERAIHRFDAWASMFGDTRTELELQPSGRYKPVTRFAEFVNVPELVGLFRTVADVVLKDDLRGYVRLPALRTGKRQIVTTQASPRFRAYQRVLDARISAIEARDGPAQKGDDILLSVITDGRHAAIDLRLVDESAGNEPGNKLNTLIDNVHRIWTGTSARRYRLPTGEMDPIPGAAQMIFSDLGTLSAEATRGFSAYRWIKSELVRLGVPAHEVAYMQDYKTAAAKQRLFNDVNRGRVRVLIGSSQTMGTGVNAQQRLAALHHLDVPWLPAHIEQREGRIERQGNQNDEIDVYAYATLGSMDATQWQLLERKARFIDAALGGDRSVRRLDDMDSQVNQFAMAKALASGDQRLMQKAGLEAEIARLERLRAAHVDDQHAVRRTIADARAQQMTSRMRCEQIEADLRLRTNTRGDLFRMEVEGRMTEKRNVAGANLMGRIALMGIERRDGVFSLGWIGGFEVKGTLRLVSKSKTEVSMWIERTGFEQDVDLGGELTPLGLIARLEYKLDQFEVDLATHRRRVTEGAAREAGYATRLGGAFPGQAELDQKGLELDELDAALAGTPETSEDDPEADAVALAA